MNNWKNKHVLIMGLGSQGGGVGVARYFAKIGAIVTITDLKTADELSSSINKLRDYPHVVFHLGGHNEEDFECADLVVKGPSVRWDNLFIEVASKRGIPIIMETAYFAQHTNARMIGITGTRGKSTTTKCIFETLSHFYTKGKVYLAGNVPGTCAIELLGTTKPEDIVVLELSSWQLSGFHRAQISPQIGVFTTIYEDHLNYYEHMQTYVYDKAAIFLYQEKDDILITHKNTWEILQESHITAPGLVKTYATNDFPDTAEHLTGSHNKLNLALAYGACIEVLPHISKKNISYYLSSIKGLHFRQECVGVFEHITVINDSTSTTPIATITALQTFRDKPSILILGGNAKRLSLDQLVEMISFAQHELLEIVLLKGSMTDEIYSRLRAIPGLIISTPYDDFENAIEHAISVARKSSREVYLLFSPGATSFAQFTNEFDRGEKFNSIVSVIMKK